MLYSTPLRFAVRCLSFAALFITLSTMSSALCFAQSSSATLSGTVEDQNGGLIAGASVMIINTSTGLQRTATTNEQGGFTVPLLPPALTAKCGSNVGFFSVEVRQSC